MVDYPPGLIFPLFLITHESTIESTPENRIISGSGGSTYIDSSGGCTLIYDGNSNRWRMIGYVI